MALRIQGSLVHWGRGFAQRALVSATQYDGPSRPLDLAAEVHDHSQVLTVLTQFRHRGHLLAQLDPLKRVPFGPWLGSANAEASSSDLLTQVVSGYDLTWTPTEKCDYLTRTLRLRLPATADRLFSINTADADFLPSPYPLPVDPASSSPGHGSIAGATAAGVAAPAPLHVLVDHFSRAYCGTLAYEGAHVIDATERAWLAARAEEPWHLDAATQHTILHDLIAADAFERFLADRFPASKRFGLEGCESVIPGLSALCARASRSGVSRIEIGMAHRGRLNVLHNLLGKPLGALCSEMEGHQSEFHVGDVKYHLGQSGVREMASGGSIALNIAPNPSHLEYVHPVVLGAVRALQQLTAAGVQGVMGLLVHGDAAMAGLGIVTESLQMSTLSGYSTGGSVHCVINNQIGFTTVPENGRSSVHASDCARAVGVPVLHANADDPEAVVRAFQVASDWRARFQRDIVVDVCGYRRHGHNEQDEPMTTLPLTYAQIAAHPTVLDLYSQRMITRSCTTRDAVDVCRTRLQDHYALEYEQSMQGAYKEKALEFLESHWQSDALASIAAEGTGAAQTADEQDVQGATGIGLASLTKLGLRLCGTVEGRRSWETGATGVTAPVQLHPAVEKLLARRRDMVAGADSRVDFAFAELLALGSLSLRRRMAREDDPVDGSIEGLNVSHFAIRLTGQDVERGTFNQRHAVFYDQATGARVANMRHLDIAQDPVEVHNSPLNEAAVLGFEYGYSVAARKRTLVLWEAQFGDFANGAQVIIDQFVASGGHKWGQQSGLVMLLPHGHDGQGPDHSSARLERFLQLANDDPDHLPGHSPRERQLIVDTFAALTAEFGGRALTMADIEHVVTQLGILGDAEQERGEMMSVLWGEMGLAEGAPMTVAAWEAFMLAFLRRTAEREANLALVVPSTPAQLFHVLRRQANLPYQRPLIIAAPKMLHHHRPATSALSDFGDGTFFNRVIDDGKASDNTRHLAHDRRTGRPFLRPDADIARLVLCSGQLYYALSRARRARRIDSVVLVRLEQIAPFPHDIVMRVARQYPNAEVAWAQEEPKNQGAWQYIRPRLRAAMQHDEAMQAAAGHAPLARGANVRYIGRPVLASSATAAYWIHAKELQELVDACLTL